MRFLTISATVAFISGAVAWHKGINIGAQNPDGSCKSQADWERAFGILKSIPPALTSARVFASSDCDTLARAVPAALRVGGVKLLAGVWTQDEGHYDREKQALLNALAQWPNWQDWLLAVSVGSEDLYRKEAPAWQIAQKVYDVRGMINAKGVTAWVGHVDTWTAWVDPANADVIKAVDFIGHDAYPFWQGTTIPQSADVFWQSVQATRDAADKVKPGVAVWVTETGWPVAGKNFGDAIASRENAAAFWKAVACPAYSRIDLWWYAYQDYNDNPSFGIVDGAFNPIYDLAC